MRRILLIFLCLAFALGGCSPDKGYIVHTPSETKKEQIRWNSFSESLLMTAKNSDRPILLYFSSKTCIHCAKFQQNTLSDPAIVTKINDYFIPVYISNLNEEESNRLMTRFNVPAWPSVVILSSTKQPVEILNVSGNFDSDQMDTLLQSSLSFNNILITRDILDNILNIVKQP